VKQAMNSNPDLACKLILVGNGSVGKSSITQNFVEDKFQRVYKQVCSFLPSFEVGVAKGCWRGVTSRHY
jgi:GTPase SAR1 family protein